MKLVTAAIIIENNEILIARRSSKSKLPGFWEFPGGKIEGDETPQECLERELEEELGIKSKAKEIIKESRYKYSHGEFLLLAILTKLLNHEFKLTAHDKVRWIPISKLLEYKLAPADIPIANHVVEKYSITA